jgi:hypothetical protein
MCRNEIVRVGGLTDILSRRRYSGRRLGCSGELKKSEQIAFAYVEEEMMAAAPGQFYIAHQRHPQDIAIEVNRPLPIAADQCQMIDSAQFELRIFQPRFSAHVGLRVPISICSA